MKEKNKYRIFLSPPHQSGQELEYFNRVLQENWLAPGGMQVEQLESQLKNIANRKYCVALNSGTAALHLALKALKVGPGDFVFCQSFSFVATANPIAYVGAHPIFIDSEATTWNMDPALLEEAIVDLHHKNIRPKAIIYAHIYGMPALVKELLRISQTYQIPIIEDAAEALGSSIDGKSVGQFGDISILSFNGNKVVTTAGGGALLTDDEEIAHKALMLATQARSLNEGYQHTEVGYNYRMSNLSAALGQAQLGMLKKWVNQKRNIFQSYQRINASDLQVEWIDEVNGIYANRWLSVFLFRNHATMLEAMETLLKNGIESRRFWMPLDKMGIYRIQKAYLTGMASRLFELGICLPSGVGLTVDEQQEIIHLLSH
ncbi:MAG: pyridoxal phosphate-dependent aminotransferase [Cyclobacteriaceae bacterium]|nr:pyridoxal phosphate-dependent aminotransferase [Cyclobacteriaceae bacterium]